MTRRRATRAVRLAGLWLLAELASGTSAAWSGTLRIEVSAPVAIESLAARVLARDGELVAVVRAGEAAELDAGTYRVELMTDPPLARPAVTVPRTGEAVARFTELGALRLSVEGADGAPMATVAEVMAADGRRLLTIASGEVRLLPAGTYQVVLRTRPNRNYPRVRIAAGETAEIAVRLGASLALEAHGPGGAPAPVHARVVHPDGSVLVLARGERLGLPPGEYDIALDTIPPTRRKIALEPGHSEVLRIDDLGALHFDLRGQDAKLAEVAVTVLDPASGLVLARARNGDELIVRPGRYRVRFEAEPPVVREGVRVSSRQSVRVGRAVAARTKETPKP